MKFMSSVYVMSFVFSVWGIVRSAVNRLMRRGDKMALMKHTFSKFY